MQCTQGMLGVSCVVWDCSNGKCLCWFHNHGGKFVGELGAGGKGGHRPYDDRNPAWLVAGLVLNLPQAVPAEATMPLLPEFNRRDPKSEDQRAPHQRSRR